jgi:hypothetical protein
VSCTFLGPVLSAHGRMAPVILKTANRCTPHAKVAFVLAVGITSFDPLRGKAHVRQCSALSNHMMQVYGTAGTPAVDMAQDTRLRMQAAVARPLGLPPRLMAWHRTFATSVCILPDCIIANKSRTLQPLKRLRCSCFWRASTYHHPPWHILAKGILNPMFFQPFVNAATLNCQQNSKTFS